jgi:hypothetical protein
MLPDNDTAAMETSPDGSVGADAATVCPPEPTVQCALCGGLYYCDHLPRAPACPPGLQVNQSCTTTCIACGDGVQESEHQDDAWYWQCVNGTYANVYTDYDPCPQ